MFYVTILGSGSAGNCALIESATARVLLDGGLSAKQMRERLALCGVNPVGIDAILLTHEHSDHAGGVEVWCKQFGTPVYANGLTAEALRRASKETKADWRVFTTGADFEIKDIAVQNFSVPHDAMDPVGFMLHHGGESLGFLTDLGFATKLACERVRQAHTLFIEANHDEKLLQLDTRRPWATKQRIMSRHGHLSNAAAGNVLAEMLGANLRRAVLGFAGPRGEHGAGENHRSGRSAGECGGVRRDAARGEPEVCGGGQRRRVAVLSCALLGCDALVSIGENSPALQSWDYGVSREPVPEGRKNAAVFPPGLASHFFIVTRH